MTTLPRLRRLAASPRNSFHTATTTGGRNAMNRAQRRAFRDLPRAEYQRIGDQMETSGCSRCHVRFGGGVPYFIGKLPSGKWAGRCMKPECASAFLQTAPVFIGTTIVACDPWTEDDREWFLAHPTRSWRLRYPFPGELPTFIADWRLAGHAVSERQSEAVQHTQAVAVHQFEPGKRARIMLRYASDDAPASYTDAGIIALVPTLLDIVQQYEAPGPADAMSEKVKRRVEAWASAMRKEGAS